MKNLIKIKKVEYLYINNWNLINYYNIQLNYIILIIYILYFIIK